MTMDHRPLFPDSRTTCLGVDLTPYDGRRVAVVVYHQGQPRALCGIAEHEYDDLLGRVLRVKLDEHNESEGRCDLVVSERHWDGKIVPDTRYGCHFCFLPSHSWPPTSGKFMPGFDS